MSRAEIINGIKHFGDIYISNFDGNIKRDKEIVLIAVHTHGTALEFVDKSMQDNKEVVLAAVRNRGNALKYASGRLKDDEDVVFSALQNNAYAIRFASQRLQQDKKFLHKVEEDKQKRYAKVNPPIKRSVEAKKERLIPRQCFAYDISHFNIWKREAWAKDQYTSENEIQGFEKLYLWKKRWDKKQKHMAVVVKTDKRLYRNNFFECYPKKGKLECRGECDSGHFLVDKRMRISLDAVHFSKETMQGEELEMILTENSKSWVVPKSIPCPEYVHEGRYVCYDDKSVDAGIRYKGCLRSHVSCASMRKRHFGHYASDDAAEAAFYRCERSDPIK